MTHMNLTQHKITAMLTQIALALNLNTFERAQLVSRITAADNTLIDWFIDYTHKGDTEEWTKAIVKRVTIH